MKGISRCIAVMLLIGCICSCSENKTVRENFYRGMYEGLNQLQETKHADRIRQPDEEPPTYDRYKRERQEILTGNENAGSNK